jgi:hypothetical protein
MKNSDHGLGNLLVNETSKTPRVDFRKDGKIKLEGSSLPDNSIEFYKPLLDWVEKYSEDPAILTEFNVKFKYFNTHSSKCILDILKKIEFIYRSKNSVIVNWYYNENDEDMLEAGEDFESIIRVPFKFCAI